mgnify:FL=1
MRLPTLTSQKVVRILKRIGFQESRQTGSHLILLNKTTKKIVPVPLHNKDIKRGLLLSIIKQAGMTSKDFFKLLQE